MQTKSVYCMHPSDILVFLKNIKENVRSIDDLLAAIREENQRAEVYGQTHIPELMEVSAYQYQLEQLEMKLKAPSLIKISFTPEEKPAGSDRSLEEKAEELLLGVVMRLISHNGVEQTEENKRFRLIL